MYMAYIDKKIGNATYHTSTDVVLLETRDMCMITKPGRLMANAKLRTARSYKNLCHRRENENENAG